ncbi:MAG: 3'-5' exonuclease [Rhodocyclaceae bacterium]|nr:3'-5' exonuclease [Rhodocyclaceae bacterium]
MKRATQDDAALPPYPGIALADVLLVDSPAAEAMAASALLAADVVGFDTESKPTFAKGEISTGPHLVQLATDAKAYLFPVERLPSLDGLKAVLESPRIRKVGFGLDSDVARLKAKLGIETQNVVDLAIVLRRAGEKNTVGARTAVTRCFGQRLQKSRRVSTSNWAQPRLSESQMLYAADDAQVALRVYRATQAKAAVGRPAGSLSAWLRRILDKWFGPRPPDRR